ncbi:uncharacterized protein LOC143202343 isoform X2 [Rhynchophorus ferrugineus]|uniref:uncharacterized protein LOC143202343 isoform X2 n=1 Tax=Rhynchophorus ferrugineus TaxID=354439 RepID=UPI003FCC408C
MKQIYDRYHVRHFCDTLNFPLSTYEQFSDGENNTMSPEYVQMEVDQNQNDIEVPISIVLGLQPGFSKQVSSTFEQTNKLQKALNKYEKEKRRKRQF